jgi:hypothetical protein
MTDARMGLPAATSGNGALGFLRETLDGLRDPRLLVPVLVLTVLLTASNIVILLNAPVPGEPPIVFAIAAFVRVAGLWLLAVAILRLLARSPRAPFRPDGAFGLYGLTLIFGIALTAVADKFGGDRSDPVNGLLMGAAMLAIGAPFAAWFAAIAVERPLAANPAPWFRRFAAWLPQLLAWSLLLVLPLSLAHVAIDMFLLRGAGDYFWPLALIDGPLSVLMALLGLALASTAYRRVARG